MDVDCKLIRDILVVRLSGEMDLLVAEKLRNLIDVKLSANKIRTLVLNLEKVTFIDSSGLGVIIGRYKKISAQNGKMYIVGAKDSVKQILQFSGINKLVPLCQSEQEIVNN